MSEETGTMTVGEGGATISRIINYLIIILIVALVAVGGVMAYMYIWHKGPVDPTLTRALESWKQAVKDDPSNSLARANLGATYLDMGEVDDAIEQLEIALEMDPGNLSYTLKLGEAYREKGDLDRALELFIQSADQTPESEKYVPYYEAAVTAREKGDQVAAMDYATRSVEDNDMIWNSHLLLGELYESEGNLEKAREQYNAAARFNPTDEELQQAIERVSG